MAAYLAPIANAVTFFNSQGVILAGGKIFTYLAGTTTPAATYTDSTQATPNANPIILGSNGMYANEIWLPAGIKYKFVYTDSNNNVLGTYDNLSGINDPTIFSSSSVGTSFVRGLVGKPNATTPLTKYDISTISTTYQSASSGTITDYSTNTLTVDLGLAGPIANGRDQLAVFPATNFIYIYKISNGTTSALIASLSAPSVGPNLPTGYVYWAFATCLTWNGSSNIVSTYTNGNRITFQSPPTLVGNATSTTEVSVSNSLVPTIANRTTLFMNTAATTNASGSATISFTIRVASGINYYFYPTVMATASVAGSNSGVVEIPNVNNTFYYFHNITAPATNVSAYGTNILILSYTIPNGDS